MNLRNIAPMYSLLKKIMFLLGPEQAHKLAMQAAGMSGGMLKSLSGYVDTKDPYTLWGLHFRNRIGIAAGFDKNGDYLKALGNMGFGHIEVGTVTPRPQPGNPAPRLFRLPADRALINRMGFNNEGVDYLADRIEKLKSRSAIIGGNIGKNKVTPNEDAVSDYLICMQRLHDLVDYFTVNVSSPNTPGLRALQEKEPLLRLLSTLQEYNQGRNEVKPLLLKIAPDLTPEALMDIVAVAAEVKLDGIIATNTTLSRNGLKTPAIQVEKIGSGGLSGAPLTVMSRNMVSLLRQHLPAEIKIIGVGGISANEHYQQMMAAGADMVQLFTGFIYEGPAIVSKLLK
jgi:dihydroorotate dehydrogenase